MANLEVDIYTITDPSRIEDGQLDQMLTSTRAENIHHYIGVRGSRMRNNPEKNIQAIDLPLSIGSSQAKNRLLEAFPPEPDSIIIFLDDDAQFDELTLQKLTETWAKNDIGFVLGRLNFREFFNSEVLRLDQSSVEFGLSRSNSCTTFIKGEKMKNFRFDERLGILGKFNSGEDQDLFLYLLSSGCVGVFDPQIVINHPKRENLSRYFPGSIAVLQKYKKVLKGTSYLKYRRVLHGLILFFQKKILFDDFKLSIMALFITPIKK